MSPSMIHLTIVRGDNTTLLEYPEPVLLSTVFAEKSWFARAAAVSGRPRCARYGLGRRSLI